MHIEPTLLNPACQTLDSVGIIVSSEGFALGPIFFAFSSSSQTLKHLVTKWRVTCFLGVIVLCTSYIEMCRKHLCLTTAFYRDRLQYLHLPEASACLLIKQQELWLRVELLDWQFYFYSWALLYSPEVFWFSLSENRKSDSCFSETDLKEGQRILHTQTQVLWILCYRISAKLYVPTEILWPSCSTRATTQCSAICCC